MRSEAELKFSKWANMLIFFSGNLIAILFISMMKFDYTSGNLLHFSLSLNFDLFSTVSLVVITFILLVAYLYYQAIRILNKREIIEIYPRNTLHAYSSNPLLTVNNYSVPELISLVKKVCQKSDVNVKRIYLTVTPLPNAYTLNIPLFGSVLNINTNLIDIFSESELEAVIAHEIGHVRGRDAFFQLLWLSPSKYLQVIFFYLYFMLFAGIIDSLVINQNYVAIVIRAVICAVIFALVQVFTFIMTVFIARGQKAAELLSDIHAARITSPLITINMLIQLGQRAEVIKVLMKEFQKMEALKPFHSNKKISTGDKQKLMRYILYFPIWELDERKAKAIAPYIYLVGELQRLKNTYLTPLSDWEIMNLAYQSVENIVKNKKIPIEEEESEKTDKLTRDWRDFDYNKNVHLEEEELQVFIDHLSQVPNKFMFKSEIGVNPLLKDHPDIRKRIINVYSVVNEEKLTEV
ncbi:MAG: M48 family metalloprotease [Candidatus Odinarchaeota archaeon]